MAARRARDAARRLLPHQEDPAADRRRDDEPRAHRGEDRAALRRAGRSTCPTPVARGRRLQQPALRRARDALHRRARGRLRAGPRAAREQEGGRRWSRSPTARANKTRDRLGGLRAAGAEVHRPPRVPQLRPGRDRRAASTGARSSRPGTWPGRIRRSSTTRSSASRRARVLCRRQAHAAAHHRGPLADAPTASSALLSGEHASATTTSRSTPTSRATEVLMTWRGLRHAERAAGGRRRKRPNRCLADFVAPKGSGNADYIGAVRGHGRPRHREEGSAVRRADHDDYSAIMLKALADRLAEAFAERLHQRVRTRPLGLRAGRGARQRGADRRAVSRHPAGAGLSGLPRPQRQARAVRVLQAATRSA